MRRRFSRQARGLSLLELIIAMAILSVLAAAVLPLAEVTVKRSREIELRQTLRVIRTAIDQYKADHDLAKKQNKISASLIDQTGYPKTLEELLEPTDWDGMLPFKRKYLRRIPRDPFDRDERGWGMRSSADDPDSTIWDEKDVFDVYSQCEDTALDGSKYNEW
jgi:general secretion pathway protein G